MTTRCNSRASRGIAARGRQSGASLVEVVVATMVFMFAFQAAMLGFGSATERQQQAEHLRAATMIAEQLQVRLQALGDASCDAGVAAREITRDRITSNVLACLGTDVTDPQASCDIDHPQNVAEMQSALSTGRAGARETFRIDPADPRSVYVGTLGPYRVVWNVYCTSTPISGGIPAPAMKRIQINVAWPPVERAFSEGRVVTFSYTASGSGF